MAAGEERQGAAAGLTAAATGLGSLAAPIAGTELYRIQPEAPYWIAILVAAALTAYVWSPHRGLLAESGALAHEAG